MDVRRAVGTEGAIQVVKDVGMKDYFSGASPIVSGELGEDFTYYFATSEQTPSSVGLGVLVNPDNSIKARVDLLYKSCQALKKKLLLN